MALRDGEAGDEARRRLGASSGMGEFPCDSATRLRRRAPPLKAKRETEAALCA
jgi:hypothetical protein